MRPKEDNDLFDFSKGERWAILVFIVLLALFLGIRYWIDSRQDDLALEGEEEWRNEWPAVIELTEEMYGNPRESLSVPKREVRSYPNRKADTVRSAAVHREQRPAFPRTEKFPQGTIVELNRADTTILKKIPGIGPAFAGRIVRYRERLGGFYTVTQLSEVYKMEEERYRALVPWFKVDTLFIRKLPVNRLSFSDLLRHPYLTLPQVKMIDRIRRRQGTLKGWKDLQLLEEFTEQDRERLRPYLSFE